MPAVILTLKRHARHRHVPALLEGSPRYMSLVDGTYHQAEGTATSDAGLKTLLLL